MTKKRQISCRHQSRVGLFGGDYGKYHTSGVGYWERRPEQVKMAWIQGVAF